MEVITQRLLLREYRDADNALFQAYNADLRAQQFYDPGENSSEKRQDLVPMFMRWASQEPRQNWQLAIAERTHPDSLVGSVGLRTKGVADGVANHEAEFGVELAASYWGLGYATEAAHALLHWGFTTLNLDIVRATTVSANTRIEHLMRRLGFQPVAARARSAWLIERAWTEVEWKLLRTSWSQLSRQSQ